MTNETEFFRKIYLSVYSKGLQKSYVWEVSWRLKKDCNILTPSSFVFSSISFSFCRAAQPGTLRAQLPAGSGSHCIELQQLTPNSKLTRTPCGAELYNCLNPTCFSQRRICTQFNPSTVKVIPWYLRPDAPVIYTGAFLIWQLGRVEGQYVTHHQSHCKWRDFKYIIFLFTYTFKGFRGAHFIRRPKHYGNFSRENSALEVVRSIPPKRLR